MRIWLIEGLRMLRSQETYQKQRLFLFLVEIPVVLLLGFSLLVLVEWLDLVPSIETQRYLYSSVFQGLAALVAVAFAVVSLTHERLEKSIQVHLEDAGNDLQQLDSERRYGFEPIRDSANRWYQTVIDPLRISLETGAGRLEEGESSTHPSNSTAHRVADVKLVKDDLLRLQSRAGALEAYDNVASHLERFWWSRKHRNYLPLRAVKAFTGSILVIGVTIVSLWLMESSPYYNGLFVVMSVYGTLVAIQYMWSLFATMFAVLFGDWRRPGYEHTGLRNPVEVYRARDRAICALGKVSGRGL
jgi:hypothetical protein